MNDYKTMPRTKRILVDARDEQHPSLSDQEIRKKPERVRIAVTEGELLADLDTEFIGYTPKKANIYKGIITRIEPSLEAVFVKYDEGERHGFLPFKEISPEYFLNPLNPNQEYSHSQIKNLLREGQEVMVRVEKEERGNKGAALSTFISLAGSYLILMPNNPRAGGVSRRIEVSEERDQMRELISQLQLPEDMGIIARTAGVGKSLEELQWDLDILLNHWQAIKKAFSERSAPFLIHQESDIVTRMIRDYLHKDIAEIIIEGETVFQKAKQYIDLIRPDFSNRLQLYKDTVPLFSRYKIEQQIETAYQRVVELPSGGAIVIDHTEALVTIDVNSAKATKGGDIEETAFNTNLEAITEIARQLRLRDIGGLIVIDLIDMGSSRHQRETENHLREASKLDRARVQIGRISRFGLLEMSRQRLRPSLMEASRIICPRCGGQGTIRSVESLAMTILRILEEEAMHSQTEQVQAQLPVDIATYLLNEKREALANIEKRQKVSLLIIPNVQLQSPQYRIKRLREEEVGLLGTKTPASYKLHESIETELPIKKMRVEKSVAEPAVKPGLPAMPAPALSKKGSNIIKRFLNLMFGNTTTSNEASSVDSTNTPLSASNQESTAATATAQNLIGQAKQSHENRIYSQNRQSANRNNRNRRSYRGNNPRYRGNRSQENRNVSDRSGANNPSRTVNPKPNENSVKNQSEPTSSTTEQSSLQTLPATTEITNSNLPVKVTTNEPIALKESITQSESTSSAHKVSERTDDLKPKEEN